MDPISGSAAPARSGGHFRRRLVLAVVLLAAVIPRLYQLGESPLKLDEAWAVETATARGSLHQHLPFDQVIDPAPPLFSLKDAPPIWHIWNHMDVTHPPLYVLMLRCWEDVLGDSDWNDRILSVAASLIAIAILFDTVRLQMGVAPAFWAGVLMAFAGPVLEYARLRHSYAVLEVFALLCANVLTRIWLLGPSRSRLVFLFGAILATLMTHYFCIGAIAGLFLFAMWKMPPHRRAIRAVCFGAGLIFLIIWGPFMWRQRGLFSTEDPSTLFLTSGTQDHVRVTFERFAVTPIETLSTIPAMLAIPLGTVGLSLYAVAFVPMIAGKNRWVMLWGFWLFCTVAVVAGLDLFRGTDHLYFIRYTLLAAPAVCAIIPSLFYRRPSLMHGICGAIAIALVVNFPTVLRPDPDVVRHLLSPAPTPADLLIIAAPATHRTDTEGLLLILSRYLPQPDSPVVLLTKPATPAVVTRARASRLVFLITESADYSQYLSGMQLLNAHAYPGLGNVFVLRSMAASVK